MASKSKKASNKSNTQSRAVVLPEVKRVIPEVLDPEDSRDMLLLSRRGDRTELSGTQSSLTTGQYTFADRADPQNVKKDIAETLKRIDTRQKELVTATRQISQSTLEIGRECRHLVSISANEWILDPKSPSGKGVFKDMESLFDFLYPKFTYKRIEVIMDHAEFADTMLEHSGGKVQLVSDLDNRYGLTYGFRPVQRALLKSGVGKDKKERAEIARQAGLLTTQNGWQSASKVATEIARKKGLKGDELKAASIPSADLVAKHCALAAKEMLAKYRITDRADMGIPALPVRVRDDKEVKNLTKPVKKRGATQRDTQSDSGSDAVPEKQDAPPPKLPNVVFPNWIRQFGAVLSLLQRIAEKANLTNISGIDIDKVSNDNLKSFSEQVEQLYIDSLAMSTSMNAHKPRTIKSGGKAKALKAKAAAKASRKQTIPMTKGDREKFEGDDAKTVTAKPSSASQHVAAN